MTSSGSGIGPNAGKVRSYYDACAEQEWQRLDRHRMEWHTTWRAMAEHIPRGSDVLDVGGGPGRYAIALARAGHRVTLLDLSGVSVDLARQKAQEAGARLAGAVQGDALDLETLPFQGLERAGLDTESAIVAF